MRRIGNRKIVVPEGVSVELNDNIVKVTGKLGELSLDLPNVIKMEITDNVITLTRINEIKATKAIHGTVNANITNMIKGVTEGLSSVWPEEGVVTYSLQVEDGYEIIPSTLDICWEFEESENSPKEP